MIPAIINLPDPNDALPALTSYDWIVVNTSAGKDSQAMLDYVVRLARAAGVLDRVVAVHADLGRVEWEGTRELAERQAKHYGVRFEVVKREQNDLLDHVRERGMWPSSAARYCTSDHKRGPVRTLFTRLVSEWRRLEAEAAGTYIDGITPLPRAGRPCRLLNCMGMRAEESPVRAKLPVFRASSPATGGNGLRVVDVWHPIHGWTTEQVWSAIRASGVPHHRAYDLGMKRLSCVFCIFAPESALMIAGQHNRSLLREYVKVEDETGHAFRGTAKKKFHLRVIQERLDRGERVEAANVDDDGCWGM